LANSLNNVGKLLEAQGDYARALIYYCKALLGSRALVEDLPFKQPEKAATLLKPTPQTLVLARNYAFLLYKQLTPEASAADVRDCEKAYSLAAALHERLRSEMLKSSESKLQHGEEAANLLPRRLGLYHRLFAKEHDSRDLRAAFTAYEQSRARGFLDSLGEANATRLAGLPDKDRAEEHRLRRALRTCDAKLDIASKQGTEEAKAQLPQLWREQQEAEEALRKFARHLAETNPQYAALRFPRPCTVEQARQSLDTNEVALLFAAGEDASYVLLLQGRPAKDDKAEGIVLYPIAGGKELRGKVEALVQRERLELPGGVRSLGVELYKLLLGPLAKQIDGKDLAIVADGPLCHLPFELLVEGADQKNDGRYLLEQHRIRYAPSLTALHMVHLWEEKRPPVAERSLWALGDPVYSDQDERVQGEAKSQLALRSKELLVEYLSRERGEAPGNDRFVRLQNSSKEVVAIRDLLGAKDAAVLTDLLATEAAVKEASQKGLLAQARYVHFATHGILGFDTGRQPALVLSLVGNDEKRDEYGTNDGFLELTEVTNLKLNADLVVLSACRSAEGRMHNGEGISGLARAFQYAGSRGVVCSLWSVDVAATAELMKAMYARLQEGQPAAQALREAKRAMIKARRAPVYWAPFILMGK
jgi:CHAT domain-containing protein